MNLHQLSQQAAKATKNWRVRFNPADTKDFFVEADRLDPTHPYDIEVMGDDKNPRLYPPAQALSDATFMVAARRELEWRATHKHLKSGGLYRVITDDARLEWDMRPAVVYDNAEGHVWVRPCAEFFDGRFQEVNK